MRYYSTRNLKHDTASAKSFYEAIFSGFAHDGGIYVPAEIPKLSLQQILTWKNYPYWRIAAEICSLFCDTIEKAEISEICQRAAKTFDLDSTIKLNPLTDTVQILELFHGATGAFKDLSMSAFAGFMDLYARTAKTWSEKVTGQAQRDTRAQHVVALVNTTGDTGPAALAAFAAVSEAHLAQARAQTSNEFRSSIVAMFPAGWCATLQEEQMRKAGGKNAFIYEYNESPDFMDRVIAGIFADEQFRTKNPNLQLLSLNSLNWFRVMYQIVHYFWVFFQFHNENENFRVQCYVPTSASGAGHITGGIIAKLMGLPIDLVAVVNENDIIYRLLTNSDDSTPVQVPSPAKTTLATAMDGVFPYNFERLLYFATNGDALVCQKIMQEAFDKQHVTLEKNVREKILKILRVERVANQDIARTMCDVHKDFGGRFICPHTACAVCVALREGKKSNDKNLRKVCFATARAEKFTEAVKQVGLKPDDRFQKYLDMWKAKPTRANIIGSEVENIVGKDSMDKAAKQLEFVIEKCLGGKQG